MSFIVRPRIWGVKVDFAFSHAPESKFITHLLGVPDKIIAALRANPWHAATGLVNRMWRRNA
jgi:hypothetical protein